MTHLATFAMREDAGRAVPAGVQPIPELAVLVPTRNEAANIEELLRRVSAAVTGIPTEIVFVDDSDDDTPTVIRTVAHRRGVDAPWACVLDGDLQHPPEVIPALLAAAERDGADLAIASRYRGEEEPTASGRSEPWSRRPAGRRPSCCSPYASATSPTR